ncbi:MAG: hypothetical protein WAV46_01530 [Candidatus Moraniibacteriota bacterium]
MVFLFFSLVGLITLFANKVFSDQNLYYYTFSTIVQGFLALVAFLGAVVIYKLQIIESDLEKISNNLYFFIKVFPPFSESVEGVHSWAEIMNEGGRIINTPENKTGMYSDSIQRAEIYWNKLRKLSSDRGDIRTKMVDFSLFSFLNVGFSLISMPITRLFVEQKLFYFGEVFIIIGILISCFSLFLAFGIIRAVLGYSFSAKFEAAAFKLNARIH